MLEVEGSKRVKSFRKMICDMPNFVENEPADLEAFFSALSKYSSCKAKFDESVDACFLLNIDPKKGDNAVKTVCVLPHGNGRQVNVLVFAEGEMAKKAKELGAKYVGSDDIVEDIIAGRINISELSACIATQDLMPRVAKTKVAQILGRAGLMPNIKLGTVAADITRVLKETLAGRVSVKADKFAAVKCSIGRISFSEDKLKENLYALYNSLKAAKPAAVKGSFFGSLHLSSTMMGASFNIKMSNLYNNA